MTDNEKHEYIKLPESELSVMLAVWDMAKNAPDDICAGELMNRYPAKFSHLKLTTVITLLGRLCARGALSCEKRGRVTFYTPLIDEEKYRCDAASDFIDTVCRSDAKELISALWNSGRLSSDDVASLREMLRRDEEQNASDGSDGKGKGE